MNRGPRIGRRHMIVCCRAHLEPLAYPGRPALGCWKCCHERKARNLAAFNEQRRAAGLPPLP